MLVILITIIFLKKNNEQAEEKNNVPNNTKEQRNNIEAEKNVTSNGKYKLKKKRGRKSTKITNEGESQSSAINKVVGRKTGIEWTEDVIQKRFLRDECAWSYQDANFEPSSGNEIISDTNIGNATISEYNLNVNEDHNLGPPSSDLSNEHDDSEFNQVYSDDQVCDSFGCADSDVLAAMDAAIDDGVDILSLSLGRFTSPFHDDPIALGAYSATERGILVSCSAGNSGPFNSSVSNEAPWILTVGASTLDRKIKATVQLGNKQEIEGESAFHPKDLNSTFFPLYEPGKNEKEFTEGTYCQDGLEYTSNGGKIVLCQVGGGITRVGKGQVVKDSGGVGMIIINQEEDGFTTSADAHVLPALDVTYADGMKILAYMNSTKKPVARITFQGTIIGDKNAPVVAGFSSRGPSTASPGILKPDIIGPGVNILAAWPNSMENNTNTKSTFNIISGTSMSCPHLSGVAALLKSAHPTWSPAAIKSAIMTTADIVNLANNPILDERLLPANIFATGAGHVNPSRANDPGLVYDIPFKSYLLYLCGLNYTSRQMGNLLQRKVNCSEVKSIPEAQLNYPSFSITLGENSQTYTRTVTNVGEAKSSYNVEIVSPQGVSVTVNPSTLKFSKLNQKMTYQVTFSKTTNSSNSDIVQGFLKWTSNRHSVRSPIAVVLV
ncbi:hypothetical protein HAX54_003972 [Datura stramonium]|uniref:Uncharacterized protein n=1 Tax=Datura stramonium TaxID=4076 RepID=A0ABS8T7K8_DATST|nr:hypothetical protein [Datura stramonium]